MSALSDPLEIATVLESLSYHLTLRAQALAKKESVELPPELDTIVELLAKLPSAPGVEAWAFLRAGRIPGQEKGKKKKESTGSRNVWTDEMKEELVKLVEDKDYRSEKIGKEGSNKEGKVVWVNVARYFNFKTANPAKSHYYKAKGIELPSTALKVKRDSNGDGAPPAKKQKTEEGSSSEEDLTDDWTKQQSEDLVKLVQDSKFRKEKTGKKSIKWGRIGGYLSKSKQDCKKQYTTLTGEDAPEA